MKLPFNHKSFLPCLMGVIIFLASSCEGDKRSERTSNTPENQTRLRILNTQSKLQIGDEILLQVENLKNEVSVDSVHFYANEDFLGSVYATPFRTNWISTNGTTGFNLIRSISFLSDSTQEVNRINVRLLSDIKPQEYSYRVIKRYRHDQEAFTQGLLYSDGILYEGTGHKGESSIRKVDLNSGEVIKIKYLPSDYFGEGITLYEDKLYQLTWKAGIGFIYDKDLEKLKEFKYPTEGWGLATYNNQLIMSDGSATIYLFDPQSLREIERFEVYNQDGPVTDLNELEMVNGQLYANVYTTDDVVIIDPSNGKVTGRIDFSGLLDGLQVNEEEIDVLNGIAYDAQNDRLFVTGKWWPYLFEVDIIPETETATASTE